MSSAIPDPAIFSTLAGTLTPEGLLSQIQAAQDEANRQVAAQTADASQQAQQAGQAYQQAAAAPVPDLAPTDVALPQLFGRIAEAISQDPTYAAQAQGEIARQRQSLLQTRAANLQALRDTWAAKADAAQKLGDLNLEQQARSKVDTLSKALDVVLQNQHQAFTAGQQTANLAQEHANRLSEIAAQGEQQRQTQAAGLSAQAGSEDEASFDNATFTTRAGRRVLDLTNFAGKKKDRALNYAAKVGAVPVSAATSSALRTGQEVQAGLDQVEAALSSMLPHQTGAPLKDFLARQAAGASNAFQALTQATSPAAAFTNTLPLAIRSLQAVAAGMGSGFRLNQSEINMIRQRWPRLNDNLETAQAKLRWERWFLGNKESSLLDKDFRVTQPEPVGPNLPATGLLSGQPSGSAENDPLGIRGGK